MRKLLVLSVLLLVGVSCMTSVGVNARYSELSFIQTRLADPQLSPPEFCDVVSRLDTVKDKTEHRVFPLLPTPSLKLALRNAMQTAHTRYINEMQSRIRADPALTAWQPPHWLATGNWTI